jgi:hypothetical protein
MANPVDKVVEKTALVDIERRIENELKKLARPDLSPDGLLTLYQIRDYLRKDVFK